MTSTQKNTFIFLFIMFQTLLAISAGLLILSVINKNGVSGSIYAGDVDIGGLTRGEAVNKVEDFYDGIIKNEHIRIKLDGNNEYKLKYSEIGFSVDYEATVDEAFSKKGGESFINMINSSFFSKGKVVKPVASWDDKKLKMKMNDIAAMVNRDPIDANLYIKDDKVEKVQQSNGARLNIDKAVLRFKSEVGVHVDTPIEFKSSKNGEIEAVAPMITALDLEGADQIIAKYSTEIKSKQMIDSAKIAASAINRVALLHADKSKGEEAGEFSFNKYLDKENGIQEQDNEGYNQVVSTLNAAVLLTDIDTNAISRTTRKTPADYIDKGLDAVVLGRSVDYRFKNTLDSALVIFAEVKDNKVNVTLVGKKKDRLIESDLKVEIEQEYEPSVVSVENQSLAKGQQKPLSEGKRGYDVSVYKIERKNGKDVDKKLIYSIKYDAVDAVVQVGPNTKWQSKNIK